MVIFYQDVKRKISGRMRLQTDQEFQQNIIKTLNKEYNIEMYSTKLRNGKTFQLKKKFANLSRSKRIKKNGR